MAETIITNADNSIVPTLEAFRAAPISSMSDMAWTIYSAAHTWLYNFNIRHEIDGISIARSQGWSTDDATVRTIDSMVMGAEVVAAATLIGLTGTALWRSHTRTNEYFVKTQVAAYDKRATSNHKLQDQSTEFESTATQLLATYRGAYQNAAIRMVIPAALETSNPANALDAIQRALPEGADPEDIVRIASRYLPKRMDLVTDFDDTYGDAYREAVSVSQLFDDRTPHVQLA